MYPSKTNVTLSFGLYLQMKRRYIFGLTYQVSGIQRDVTVPESIKATVKREHTGEVGVHRTLPKRSR